MAAQLMAMNRPGRSLAPWTARAYTSFPTPVSPTMSSSPSEVARRRSRSQATARAGDTVAQLRRLGEPRVVEPGAVLAAEILDLVAAGNAHKPRMLPRDDAVGEHERVRAGARLVGRAPP